MSGVISPIAGTRIEPVDSYLFVRGTAATFKIVFLSDDKPTKVDVGTQPEIKIYAPRFLLASGGTAPELIATISGTLVAGQQYEYEFVWNIPVNTVPLDEYIVSYFGQLGGVTYNFGDEYFTVTANSGVVNIKKTAFATVDDIRKKKFNIDDYLPAHLRSDLVARNRLIESHLVDATNRLREELNLAKTRGNTENYRLFTIFYTIWSLLLASRGEDGSSVSDSNLNYYRTEWERILAQEKRESVLQGIPLGRG